MSSSGIILTFICSICVSFSSFFLRASIDKAGGFYFNLTSFIRLSYQPLFISGIFLYGFAAIIWLRVLSTEQLTIAYPFLIGLTFFIVSCGGVFFFKESITLLKIIGLGSIIMGIFLVAKGGS